MLYTGNNQKENMTDNSFLTRLKIYWELFRPHTLVPPAMGMITMGVVALGAEPKYVSNWARLGWTYGFHFSSTSFAIGFYITLGAVMAVLLNAASNSINQVADFENDLINKPLRPLPSGRMTVGEASTAAIYLWILALVLSFVINLDCFVIVVAASFFVYGYSMPPMRLKARGGWANFAIAIPRGLLLPVAGWSTVKSMNTIEPWFLGSVFFLFVLGASSTKDFSDVKGDCAAGCRTLPVVYGPVATARFIAPFFVFPFLLIPVGVSLNILTGNPVLLNMLAVILCLWGAYTIRSILANPDALAEDSNHPSWKHMYLMMMFFQVGLALSYLL